MTIDVIGIDHIYISVSDLARSEAYYDPLMALLGFRKNTFSLHDAPHIQYFNRHFGYVLRPAYADSPPHDPYHTGLHHLCFRVNSVADVEAVAEQMAAAGLPCSAPQCYPQYAEDYHAIFFTDPDGIRLEVTNYRLERQQRAAHWDEV
jgi:glyoxylase I family protein